MPTACKKIRFLSPSGLSSSLARIPSSRLSSPFNGLSRAQIIDTVQAGRYCSKPMCQCIQNALPAFPLCKRTGLSAVKLYPILLYVFQDFRFLDLHPKQEACFPCFLRSAYLFFLWKDSAFATLRFHQSQAPVFPCMPFCHWLQ